MFLGFLFGVAWLIAGVYIMAWCADRFPAALDAIVGDLDERWFSQFTGWFAAIVWPLTLLLALVFAGFPGVASDDENNF